MAVQCPYCGKGYDITLFEFGRDVRCVCGKTVAFRHEQIMDAANRACSVEDARVREVCGMADRIASLIVASDYPMIDIEIEKKKLQERISEFFPDKEYLYELIYEPRFRRLREQFRESGIDSNGSEV